MLNAMKLRIVAPVYPRYWVLFSAGMHSPEVTLLRELEGARVCTRGELLQEQRGKRAKAARGMSKCFDTE